MRGFSKAIIAGNLTRDPDLRTTPSGATVCGFGVAVNRNYRDASGNQKEEVSFFNCSAWGKVGETINQYAKKGTGIIVSGRLSEREWTDRDGNKRNSLEVNVDDFSFIGGGAGNGDSGSYTGNSAPASGSNSSKGQTSSPDTEVVPDDIPEGEISIDEVPF